MGPAALRPCPFATLLSQVRARLGPGGYCRRSGNGGPQTCLPAACGVAQGAAQHGLSPSAQAQDPREGSSLVGRTTRSFLRHGLVSLAHKEAERSRQGTSRGAREASREDRDQAGARRAPACAVSLFPFRCKGGKHRPRHQAKVTVSVQRGQAQAKVSGKGYHFGAMRPRLAGRPDGGHRGAQDDVIASAFGSRRPTLVRITCTSCPPSN